MTTENLVGLYRIVGFRIHPTHKCQYKKIFLVGEVFNPDLTGEFSQNRAYKVSLLQDSTALN